MPRGRADTEAFTLALVNLGARGQRTQCSDPGLSWLWLSDSYIEHREAVELVRMSGPRNVGQRPSRGVSHSGCSARRISAAEASGAHDRRGPRNHPR